jgi:hypothetical protein
MRRIGMAVVAGAMLATGAAWAQVTPSQMESAPSGWKFEITPYAWLAGLEGDATVGGNKTEFDKSFTDLFDAVDMAGSLLAVVQYDRYLVWGQVDYFSLSTDELDVEDQPAGGKLDTKTLLAEAAVGYQLDGWADGQTFDVLVGARTMHIENDLEIYGHGEVSKDNDITDPILVVRPSILIFPSKIDGLRFNPTLAIGGGGDSELVYELQPQLQYQITENMAARVGYRTVGYKFNGDNAKNDNLNLTKDDELNFNMSGLIAGLGVTF